MSPQPVVAKRKRSESESCSEGSSACDGDSDEAASPAAVECNEVDSQAIESDAVESDAVESVNEHSQVGVLLPPSAEASASNDDSSGNDQVVKVASPEMVQLLLLCLTNPLTSEHNSP